MSNFDPAQRGSNVQAKSSDQYYLRSRCTHKSVFKEFISMARGLSLLTFAVMFMIGLNILPTQAWGEDGMGGVKFDRYGKLLMPEAKIYREWVHVGTPLTPNDMNNGEAPFPEFHAVYINPESWDVFNKTGEFTNGTVMVKELISVGSKKAPSGNGYFMGEFIGLEVAIKDAVRFPNEPGYWAYFTFTAEPGSMLKHKAKAESTSACNSCHQKNAAHDWVFTQYYPVLRAAFPQPRM